MLSSPHKQQPNTPLPTAPDLSSASPVSLQDLANGLTDKAKMAQAMQQMRQFIASNPISPASSNTSSRSTQPKQEQPDFASASPSTLVQFAPSSNPFQTQPTQASPSIVTPSFSRHPSFAASNAPPPSSSRNPSPPKVVRSRPSLEEVLASRPSSLKRRLSTDSLLSEEENSLGVLIGEGGGMEVDEEEEESIERTPSPYLGDLHHHLHQSSSALPTTVVVEPSVMEESMEAAEADMKTGGLLDNLLGGDAQVKGDQQRRWKEHKEGKTPPIGGGGFAQHNHPIPTNSNASRGSGPLVYPLPQGLGRAGSSAVNEDSPVEHQSFGLGLPQNPSSYYQSQFGHQQQRSGGFPRAVSFNEAAASSSHQAQTSYLHASSSMPMANRTLSDPFITNLPRANASSIHSSPTAAVASPYHAPPGLIKASFAGQVAQSPRQDKDCYWSSSPSGPVVGSQRTSSAGSVVSGDGGISRPVSRSSERSSAEEDDEYATPGRQAIDLPFVSDEGSSNSSHHGEEGSVFDSGGAHLYAPHSAIAGGSRMGSLLQAGQLASEHAGFSSPVKGVEDDSENNKDLYLPILKRRGEMGRSDAGDSDESELEAEEDEFEQDELEEEEVEEQKPQGWKGKEREATPEESTTGKKKGKGKGKGKKGAKSNGETASPEVQREADLPPQGLPEGPRPTTKPSFSYAGLIGQAILAHPEKRLSLNAIYDWIVAAYPFYSKTDQGWMNSIRHNLSLNVCFIKKERAPDGPAGKGNLWMIEEGAEPQFANGGYKKNRPGVVGKGKKGAAAALLAQPEPVSDSSATQPTKKRARKSKKSAAFDSDDEKEKDVSQVEQYSDGPIDGAPSPTFSSPVFLEKKVAPLAAPPPKRQKKKKAVETPAFSSSSAWATSSSSDAFGPGQHQGVLSSSRQSGLVYAPPPPPSAYRPQYNHAPGYYVEEDSAESAARGSEGDDDFATPQRPRSRGPPSGNNEASTSEGQVVANPVATRGLPHLTPSVSSPVSSPGPPTMPRQTTQGARAHQKYIKSSLHEPENVRIREEEEPEEEEHDEQDFTMEMSLGDESNEKEYPIASGSLQPAFHMQPQSSSRAPATGPPGSPRFVAGLSAGISLSPMSSVRGTAHGDEEDSYRGGPYNFPSSFGHQSPLQSRTRDPSGHKRMLSQTGSLIAHALKTPAMQPIHSSPVGRGGHPFDSSAVPHSPLGSGNRRVISYGASSVTPKGGMYSYPSAFGGGTPARTPFHPSMNQSPAGAAFLQSYGDALDPYNPSHGVEEALGQLSSSESPSGTPRNNGGWNLGMYSPGFGDSPASARKISD